jgi:hypothetical protein
VANLADIIAKLVREATEAAQVPAREVETNDPWVTWLRLGDWPPFPDPPPGWPRDADLETLWTVLWGAEVPAPPSASEIQAEADEERTRYPETNQVRQREADPMWLEVTLARYEKYASERAWLQIEQLLRTDPNTERLTATEQRRLRWVHRHANRIRPIVHEASREHRERFGD